MAERSFLRRLLLCPMGLCQTFRAAYDDKAMWGECSLCGRRSGEVSREALRGCLKVAGPLESDWRSAEVEPVTPCQEDSLTCYLPQHVFAAMKAGVRDPRLFYPSIARWIESHPAGHMQTLPLVEVEVRVRRVIERGERP